jgi:hypothetical protein
MGVSPFGAAGRTGAGALAEDSEDAEGKDAEGNAASGEAAGAGCSTGFISGLFVDVIAGVLLWLFGADD